MNLKDKINKKRLFHINDYIMGPYTKVSKRIKGKYGNILDKVMTNVMFHVGNQNNHIIISIQNNHIIISIHNSPFIISNTMKTDILNSLSI